MDPLALLLFCILCSVLLFGSRVAAATALIAGACLMTPGQMIIIGPFHFYFYRLIILVGAMRAAVRRELFDLRRNKTDLVVLVWLVVAIITSVGHENPSSHLVTMLGMAFNTVLVYFLFRTFVRSVDDVAGVTKWLIAILLILAVAMIAEKVSGHSMWERFGVNPTRPRHERVRAFGPFRHAILAGSVGAALVPLIVASWSRWRIWAMLGIGACVIITVASASSGPIILLAFGVLALWLWRYRQYRRRIAWAVIASVVLLQLVMKSNVWYLMAKVDLAGGSTGWHRAYLIDQALAHIGEWWLTGTDYTRHWMPTGVSWSPDHSDITNHYIALGVDGGLGLVLAYVGTLTLAFKSVGHILDRYPDASRGQRFVVWALGSVLFGHAFNSVNISYFDQSIVLVYFILACISSLDAYPESLSSQPSVGPEPKGRVARVAWSGGATPGPRVRCQNQSLPRHGAG